MKRERDGFDFWADLENKWFAILEFLLHENITDEMKMYKKFLEGEN